MWGFKDDVGIVVVHAPRGMVTADVGFRLFRCLVIRILPLFTAVTGSSYCLPFRLSTGQSPLFELVTQ